MMPRVPWVAIIVVGLLAELAHAKDNHDKEKEDEEKLYKKETDGIQMKCSNLGSEANKFAEKTDKELGLFLANSSLDEWNYETNVTDENARKLDDDANDIYRWAADVISKTDYYLNNSKEICRAKTFRMLRWFKLMTDVPPGKNKKTLLRITQLVNEMQKLYVTSNVTRNGTVYELGDLSEILSKSRDYNELLWAWTAWHNTTGRQMKKPYEELVKKMNEAAKDNGYSDIGVYWKYADYDRGDIEAEMDKLYNETRVLYEQLHAYVRRKLADRYKNVNRTGFIPAHLLGNMWAQQWDSIDDILLPYPNAPSSFNVTQALISKGYTPDRMFRLAEQFFVSLGFEKMTPDFWKKSMFVRPEDNRTVDCQPTSFDFASQTDFRIKMCTTVTSQDLVMIHLAMGYVESFMQYRRQPFIFRTAATAAFQEAVVEALSISVSTDAHLAAIGLIPPDASKLTKKQLHEKEINSLMKSALLKIAFLPFGYAVDKWRFRVFRGQILPANYTSTWWKIREKYGGITAPIPRSDQEFDPGAKYHIPVNIPYSRHFFGFVGQFQLHAALCREAGHKGPLHTCDIYRSKKAGDKLKSILSVGGSRPWEEELQTLTGRRSFTAEPMLEYFKPLYEWLKTENKGRSVGWERDYRSFVI